MKMYQFEASHTLEVAIETPESRPLLLSDRGDEQIGETESLEYQACDDKVCFDPVTVPLTWTVTVGESDRQRAKRSD